MGVRNVGERSDAVLQPLAASIDAINGLLTSKFPVVGLNKTLGASDPNDLSFLHLTDAQVQLALIPIDFEPTNPLLSLIVGESVFSTVVGSTLPDLQTQFLGFISTDPFNTIRLTVPDGSTWVVQDFTTASVSAVPLPAALPLFATGLAGLGLLGWRRKRKATAA